MEKCEKNEFGKRFIDIGVENVAVAAAWSSYLRAAVIRGVKSVDEYKTPARIIFSSSWKQPLAAEVAPPRPTLEDPGS